MEIWSRALGIAFEQDLTPPGRSPTMPESSLAVMLPTGVQTDLFNIQDRNSAAFRPNGLASNITHGRWKGVMSSGSSMEIDAWYFGAEVNSRPLSVSVKPTPLVDAGSAHGVVYPMVLPERP